MKIQEANEVLCKKYKEIMKEDPENFKKNDLFNAITVALDVIDRFVEIQGFTKGIR